MLELCQTKKKVYTEEIMECCHCSIATVRRDLQEMEDNHMIQRFHGGALQINANELPMFYKSVDHYEEKDRIARKACEQIKDHQVIYLDAGSSTFEMIKYIYSKDITVVTIGIPHVIELMNRNIKTIVLPGLVYKQTEAISGKITVDALSSYHFDCAFMGVNGIDEVHQITTTNKWEAKVKEKVIKQSDRSFILADHTKFHKVYPLQYAKLSDVTCISCISPIKMKYIKT
ncbi:MAG: DeoR/GlpR family DNA-binding transcription regulator [Erysipelotrichaceae bacterium]|uniref:DeoR/GlpR family DNA-binding transcription regulator n=1 Tax=Floccifex sp. TaxID=2815810 RepID=UPI002A7516F0|nr:DeoR/GlpR family DNA-binding transcription regulator [Floccifex sp.]MDD7281773.1 DeoR/GlpR family DNA-binding transcription regulator [Erysipelotrichaceae bacterium]MDY2957463.1 DeoR/GlpR family DNA-binding transcription regulator [Floccifex sp.]